MSEVENFDVLTFSKKVIEVDIETLLSQLILMKNSYDSSNYADQSGIEAVENIFQLITESCCRKV